MGLPTWCEDEAGPYQAIPQPGASWAPAGQPATQPHEYFRGGIAKLLTLFRPATGGVRAQTVQQTTNAVLHPWLEGELAAVLPTVPRDEAACATPREFWWQWTTWGWSPERVAEYTASPAVAVGLLLILDNLRGHTTKAFVAWCLEQGIALLYTPVGGSWLNMAEALQRILVRRALTGQHYQTAAELMAALTAVVRGWNRDPTPFEWHGKRWERRRRARERRHPLGGARAYTRRPVTGRRTEQLLECGNAVVHDK
ncbi:MAG: transposase [Armatimonadota bacterium]